MFNNYNIRSCKIFKNAENEMLDLNHPYVGSEHLILSILKSDDEINEILKNYGVTYDRYKNKLLQVVGKSHKKSEVILYTPLLKRIIENSIVENNIDSYTLMISLIEEGEGIGLKILCILDTDISALYKELTSYKKDNNIKVLDKVGINLNEKVLMDEKTEMRENELNMIIETLLRKNKNNPLLIGDAGVGKTAIVEELARRINKGLVPDKLKDVKIYNLEMSCLIAGTKYRGEFEEKLNNIIKEIINNKNIILFIDEIHTIVKAGGAEGAIDASNILKPYLARGNFRLIGATTTDEYIKFIESEKALARRFQVIKINEPDIQKTEYILKKVKKNYEKYHNVIITDDNIKDIVYLTDKYIKNKKNPDKSLDILDSVCSKRVLDNKLSNKEKKNNKILNKIINKKKEYLLNKDYKNALIMKNEENKLKRVFNKNNKLKINFNDIKKIIEQRENIIINDDYTNFITKLNNSLNHNILYQNNAIKNIVETFKYYREKNKPLSMLFNGTSGIGKTKTAKIIASVFGDNNLIRLDMSEYNQSISVNKLIGASSGYVGYNDINVFDKVKMNPYSVILLDEIEKASLDVINLFLQILDEGFITDNKGEKIYFNNCVIIATTNIVNKNNVGFNNTKSNTLTNHFSSEFINRIDSVIDFKSLNKEEIINFIKLNLKKEMSENDINNIVLESEYEKFGLRKLEKIINKINLKKLNYN